MTSEAPEDHGEVASAFAAYLRSASSTPALRLADKLESHGETHRAEWLRAFVDGGEQTIAADWWQPGALCHLSLNLPTPAGPGELWFSPLEVGCSLVQYWPPETGTGAPVVHGWTSLDVTPWQRGGVSLVVQDIPGEVEQLTGQGAVELCRVFGKDIAGTIDWEFLRAGYGDAVVRRLWGESPRQLGSFGPISGEMELLTFDYVSAEHGEFDDPEMVSELALSQLAFRTVAMVGRSLESSGGVTRVWRG